MAAETEVEDAVTLARAVMLTVALALSGQAHSAVRVFIVAGLGGEASCEQRFQQQATAVATAASRTGAAQKDIVVHQRRTRAAGDARSRDETVCRDDRQADDQVAVVLIGHGSYDGDEYRFSLPGPDITGEEIGAFLDSLKASAGAGGRIRPARVASVMEAWKKPNRVVITATKSGTERNATRFAEYWVQALSSPEADRDKNEIVTAAEAYDYASRKVADAFKSDASWPPSIHASTASSPIASSWRGWATQRCCRAMRSSMR